MFPVITQKIQQDYENACNGITPKSLPVICGIYGRACRQLDKQEGANRSLCTYCPLAEYAKTNC